MNVREDAGTLIRMLKTGFKEPSSSPKTSGLIVGRSLRSRETDSRQIEGDGADLVDR
jgi:hypothetical protein